MADPLHPLRSLQVLSLKANPRSFRFLREMAQHAVEAKGRSLEEVSVYNRVLNRQATPPPYSTPPWQGGEPDGEGHLPGQGGGGCSTQSLRGMSRRWH